eukprot:5939022-Prymnesium_polylepis.1
MSPRTAHLSGERALWKATWPTKEVQFMRKSRPASAFAGRVCVLPAPRLTFRGVLWVRPYS